MTNHVRKIIAQTLKPRNKRTPWEWAEEKLTLDKTSPFPGRFRSDTAPWTKRPLEKWAQTGIRYVIARCPAQTSKTQTAIVAAAYSIDEDPGPLMWTMAAADEAKTFSKTRFTPTLDSIDSIREQMPKSRAGKMVCEINFPQSPVVINGANSPSKLQSKPIRWLILDEVRNYPKGALKMALKRIRAWWNGCAMMVSTGDEKGDPFDLEWEQGTQSEFCSRLPCCGKLDPMHFPNLKWDENEETKPGGEWKIDAVTKTIRFECPHCKAHLKDIYNSRRKAALEGDYIDRNPNAPADRWSGTWSSLIVPWISWASIVEEFLTAKKALAQGVIEPLKTFVTETLGQSWSEEETAADELKDPINYDPLEKWEKEAYRWMTVDVQRDHFWFVIRSWADTGESRLVAEGRLLTKEDVISTSHKFEIRPENVVVDAGYDNDSNFVFEMCADNGWTAMRGDDRKSFLHYLEKGLSVHRPYSPETKWDPGMGKSNHGMVLARLYYWSNLTVKDVLHRLKTGNGAAWDVYTNVSSDHRKHMCSESKRKIKGKLMWATIGRRQNHLWDCECMQVVCAFISGILVNPFGIAKEDDEPAHPGVQAGDAA